MNALWLRFTLSSEGPAFGARGFSDHTRRPTVRGHKNLDIRRPTQLRPRLAETHCHFHRF